MPTDRYQQLTQSMPGRFISKRLGLPQPMPLRRYEPGQALLEESALGGPAPRGRLLKAIAKVLTATGSDAYVTPQSEAQAGATAAKLGPTLWDPDQADESLSFGALIYDATGISSTDELSHLYEFFHPTIRMVGSS